MKKLSIGIISSLILIISVSGCKSIYDGSNFGSYNGTHYENSEISFDYPEGWIIEETGPIDSDSGKILEVTGVTGKKDNKCFNILILDYRGTFDDLQYRESIFFENKTKNSNLNISYADSRDINGKKAYCLIYEYDFSKIGEGEKGEVEQIILLKNAKEYRITFKVVNGNIKDIQSDITTLINSFYIK